MIEILNVALPFFGLILAGVLAGCVWKLGEEGLAWLNIFVIYFALPSLIFVVVAATSLEKLVNPGYVTATASVTSVCFLLMLVSARRFFGTSLRESALQATSASYGNVGYMGLPLAVAFFGPEAAVPAALVFCFDCTVEFAFTAAFVNLDGPGRSRSETILKLVRDIFSHPFIIATILGVAASATGIKPAGGLQSILEMLMRAAGPVALFAMGVTVALRGKPSLGPELPVLTGIKLLLQPLLAFAVLTTLVDAELAWLQVAVMMAALPTAGNAFILARQYNSYVAGSGSAVIVTTALSVITIPLIVYALQQMS
jgi:malonate transporter and related proteins